MTERDEKIGLWLIGACGSVASTVALGLSALNRRLAEPVGLATALPVFDSLRLPPTNRVVLGGHEARDEDLLSSVISTHRRANLFSESLIKACAADLRATQRNIRPGTMYAASAATKRLTDGRPPADKSPAGAIDRLASDIRAFQHRHRLAHTVVVNLASTEPPAAKFAAHASYAKLERELARRGSRVLPTSSLYALAAIEAGCAFINFTPSLGIDVPAIRQRADALGLPYMGRDGKTGETLVKSALAPLFAIRNLRVLSWVGENILGNRDGQVLADPSTRASKIKTKNKLVGSIVGHNPHTLVSIDYVPSLDDWKVAWDFIHFKGFLGTKMSMQFTWQGSDSALAAPLVIDLARLAAVELRARRPGPMRHLACFFKDPMDVNVHDLASQWRMLVQHCSIAAGMPLPSPLTKGGPRGV